ncbi:MAG: MFS transporter [Desulfobacteraceae bacterium]|jgi:MFS family permease|nr:MFS transporter [Desulfobacteraceae bacterium]
MAVSKKFSLAIIFASATLTIMAGSIIAPVLNLMRDGLGVEPSWVGLIITTHGLFMALFSPLMGSVIDRMGARRPYIIALLCYGLAGGSGLLIDSFWVFLVSRACLGIGLAGIFAGINVLILNMYEGLERDRVMGWRGSAQSFGGVIWPMIGGALGAISWRFPFAVYMLAIPIGLLAIAGVPEPVIQRRRGADSHDDLSVRTIFRNSPVLFIIYGLIFFGNLLLYSIVIFVPQLLEGFGISSPFYIGLFITAMTASAGVTAFIYGKIRSRYSYRVIVTIAVALWTLAFTIISQASSSRVVAMALPLFGVSQGLIMPTVMVWVGVVVPPSFRGRFSSYLGTFGFIGQFLSPILFAPIFVQLGFKGVFLFGAGVGAVWFVLLLSGLGRSAETNTFKKGD